MYASGLAPGGYAADEISELRSRLDAVAQENRELRAMVERALPGQAIDEHDVRSIVEEYLARRDVQPASLQAATTQPLAAAAPRVEEVGSDLNMIGKWTPNGPELQT